jgi:ATP synthase F1 gamma subunit
MQLHELRKELSFNHELLSLVETLKNVAGSQYHLMEKQKQRFDAFMDAFSGFFRVVDLVDVVNPLVRVECDVTAVVILTSDSGFMGGLNAGVIRAGMRAIENLPEEQTQLIVIGDKGAGVLGDQSRKFKFFGGIAQDTIYEQAVVIKDYLMEEVMAKRIGKVVVAYPRALSFSAQTIDVINLLPCGELFDKESESEVREHVGGRRFLTEAREVIVESSFDDMVEYLAGVWVTSKLFEVFEDGKLAEFSARAMHLEGSMQKVEKEYKKVKQKCFKASHELIDKGMRESFAAKSTKNRKKKRPAA